LLDRFPLLRYRLPTLLGITLHGRLFRASNDAAAVLVGESADRREIPPEIVLRRLVDSFEL
jgi:hypothetical protein